MVATRDGYEAMWEREYAASLGCEFCDPRLVAQRLAELRKRVDPIDEVKSADDTEDDEPVRYLAHD